MNELTEYDYMTIKKSLDVYLLDNSDMFEIIGIQYSEEQLIEKEYRKQLRNHIRNIQEKIENILNTF